MQSGESLKRLFEGAGYSVDLASGRKFGAGDSFARRRPRRLSSTLRLPGMSGEEVCREITQIAPGLPIVVLSAKSNVVDKVLAPGNWRLMTT